MRFGGFNSAFHVYMCYSNLMVWRPRWCAELFEPVMGDQYFFMTNTSVLLLNASDKSIKYLVSDDFLAKGKYRVFVDLHCKNF